MPLSLAFSFPPPPETHYGGLIKASHNLVWTTYRQNMTPDKQILLFWVTCPPLESAGWSEEMLFLTIRSVWVLSCPARGQGSWSGCHGERMRGNAGLRTSISLHSLPPLDRVAWQEVAVRKPMLIPVHLSQQELLWNELMQPRGWRNWKRWQSEHPLACSGQKALCKRCCQARKTMWLVICLAEVWL